MREEHDPGLRLVAAYQGVKGTVAIAAAAMLLTLGQLRVVTLIADAEDRLHLGEHSDLRRLIDSVAADTSDERLRVVALLLLAYAGLRFAEGVGLWIEAVWGEWLAVISAALYLPVEIWGLVHGVTWTKAAVFVGNLLIVIYVGRALRRELRARQLRAQSPSPPPP